MLDGCCCCGRRGQWKDTPQLDRIDRVLSRTELISAKTPSLDRSTDSGLCDARSSSCADERVRIHSRDSSCPANGLAKSLTNYVFFGHANTPITISDACEVAAEVPAPERPGRTFGPFRRTVQPPLCLTGSQLPRKWGFLVRWRTFLQIQFVGGSWTQ
jgi:hypothetical protein